MKKVILITAVFMTSLAVNAQSTAQNSPQKGKTEYSFVWGLFRSERYAKEKTVTSKIEKPNFSNSVSDSQLDTTKYEQKSILWGDRVFGFLSMPSR